VRSPSPRKLVLGGALLARASLHSFLAPRVEAANGPSNGKIAFTSQRDGNFEIYTMDADGTSQVNISNNPALDDLPSWSPDGTKIAFSRNLDGRMEIFVMDADGSNQTQLTNTSPHGDFFPAWQPVPDPDTIGVFRSGQFRLRQPRAAGLVNATIVVNFGQAGDLAIDGDWNGDGIDTPGVLRPSTGQFRLTNSPNVNNSSPPASIIAFRGQEGDTPVAGDSNGGN
jgi:hypothetical protein